MENDLDDAKFFLNFEYILLLLHTNKRLQLWNIEALSKLFTLTACSVSY